MAPDAEIQLAQLLGITMEFARNLRVCLVQLEDNLRRVRDMLLDDAGKPR